MDNIGKGMGGNSRYKGIKEEAEKLEREKIDTGNGKKVSEMNNNIDNDKNDIVIEEKNYDIPDFEPATDEDFLAEEIANKWGERKNLKQLLKNIYRVGADRARPKYADVDELPKEKIKKSKGALFIWLLKRMRSRKRFDKK